MPVQLPAADALLRCTVRSEFTSRAQGDQFIIEGYAALYDVRTSIGGWYTEMIARGAFADAIAGKDDVRCLWQHDSLFPLGRNLAGTLTLTDDSRGLRYLCTMPNSQYARDAYEAIKRGDVSQSSFGFSPVEDRWFFAENPSEDLCTRVKVRLWDVSPVTYPAYENTEVSARDRRCHETAAARHRNRADAIKRAAKLRGIELDIAAEQVALADTHTAG